MDGFYQAAAGVLVSVVLGIFLSREGKEMTLVLSLAVCCMVFAVVAGYLKPVLELLGNLRQMGNLHNGMLQIMLKATGIGLISEIAVLICNDAGNAALGKVLQILTTVTLLWLAIPLVNSLLELLQQIMGEV